MDQHHNHKSCCSSCSTGKGECCSVKKSFDVDDPRRYFDIIELQPTEELHWKKSSGRPIVRRIKFQGLDISIENDKGQIRHWKDEHSGETGQTKMQYPYGYIRRTTGADGDQIDVFVGPNEDSAQVYVIHQMKKPAFKEYDEDKVMVGFESPREAKAAYLMHFNSPKFFGSMTETTVDAFKEKFVSKALGDERPGHEYIRREGEPGHYKYIYEESSTPTGPSLEEDPHEFITSKLGAKVIVGEGQSQEAVKTLAKAVDGLARVLNLDSLQKLAYVRVGVESDRYQAGGKIFAVYDFEDKAIAIDTDVSKETFHHEFGHFLDHVVGGHGKLYATEQSGAVRKWIEAVRNTPTYELWHKSWRKKRPEFGSYYNKGTEIFARYFDQWVHTVLKEKGLNPEDYHSDFMRLTQDDADRFASYGEPDVNEPLIGDKGMFTKEDFDKLRPAFEELIGSHLKKALEAFMRKNMDPMGVPNQGGQPMMLNPAMGMMPGMMPGMGMMIGPPPIDVDTFEGVSQLLGRIGSVPDQQLMEIASKIWGDGYMFEGQVPEQARQEIIGFLLDQRDLLGIAPEDPSLMPSPSLPAMAPTGSSDYSGVSRTSPVTSTVPPPGANSSAGGSPDQSLMEWFTRDF